MSNSNTEFLFDNEKLDLTKNDIYDRIINLKLITGSYSDTDKAVNYAPATVKDTYVIRSDYELYYPNLDLTKVLQTNNIATKKCYVRKCVIKPSIKVQYKRVNEDSDISIDIFVSNFFMFDASGKKLMSFNNDRYPLLQVELMMGYWGQFKNMPHKTWKDLNTFTPMYGVDKMIVNVLWVATEKLPPDSVIQIHGVVGSNVLAQEGGKIPADNFNSINSGEYVETVSTTTGNKTALENIFYQHITRRFIRDSVVPKGVIVMPNKDGYYSKDIADKYGVVCYCSKGVNELSLNRIQKKKITSKGTGADSKIYFVDGDTAVNTMHKLLAIISSKLTYAPLNSGNYLVFTEEESYDVATLKEKFVDTGYNSYTKGLALVQNYKNILPAVYNINIDKLVTIVAPFFYFVNPFEYVRFKSRYALTSLVNYYTNKGKIKDKFYITAQTVSFATVEDVNEMSLIGVVED